MGDHRAAEYATVDDHPDTRALPGPVVAVARAVPPRADSDRHHPAGPAARSGAAHATSADPGPAITTAGPSVPGPAVGADADTAATVGSGHHHPGGTACLEAREFDCALEQVANGVELGEEAVVSGIRADHLQSADAVAELLGQLDL